MLTNEQFDTWYTRQNIPENTRQIIAQIRELAPSRSVGSRKSNVCGFYPSTKMGMTIQFESHRNELSYIIDKLEYEDDVLEYYDQPPPIQLVYLSKATKRIRCSHTPDFFIIRQNTAGWEECKTEEELVLLSANKPYRYVRNENGHWRCPPGEEYARKYGLYYAIRSSKELDPVRLRNFTWLEPYFCKQPPPVNQPIKAAIISLVKALPGIAFSSLILKVQGATPDDINTLIATKQIYVNLSAAPLAEPDKVQIFLNQEIAIAKQQLIQTLPPPVTSAIQVIKVDVGSSLSWDGQPWQIINIGSKTISLQSSDRKVINLTNTAFNELVQKREITCAENQIQSNNHKEFEEILLHARPEDIETANHRYQAIQPYLQPNPPQFPPRSIRRWRDNYWNAEKLYGNGYVGLLPKHHQKGSNEPKLDQAVREFMAQYIAQHYENLKNRRITGVYRAFIEACETHEPKLEPPSEKRFRLEIRQRSGYKQTLSRCGRRAANIQKPYHSAKAIPHHGDLPWEIAHIDHTQLDDELVSSLISLTTCNSSEAISLTDINLGRPWVSFMIDSYSRRILAVYLTYEEPSYRSCMMVMRICVSRFRRLPQIIVTDNGKEFHSTYFNQLLAYYQCTHKYRPPGEPRYGAPVERIFNTNNTQWTHELKGNTQILRIPRQVTQSVSPKKQAVWTIGEFYKFLEYWAYEIYDKREHSTLGQSPRSCFETGIALGGRREIRLIEYDSSFRLLTLPSPGQGNTRVVQPGQGIKIRNIYYWSDAFLDPEIENSSVEVKYDPFDVGVAYAFVRGRWSECISAHYQYLQGRTEKEIKIITEDLRRRKSGHGKRVEVSDKELVEHLNSAIALEGELLKQRLRALENKIVLEMVEGKKSSFISRDGTPVQNIAQVDPARNSLSKSIAITDNKDNKIELYGEF